MYFWHSLLQRFSVSVSDKKSAHCDSKSGGHLDKLSGGGGGSAAGHAAPAAGGTTAPMAAAAGGRDSGELGCSRGREAASLATSQAASVKKEPVEQQLGLHRPDPGRQPRYSPPDFSAHGYGGLGSRLSPAGGAAVYHGYHVDKSLLPPSLSGPHSSDLHGQKFDFFRGQNGESETGRGLQSHGLC